MKKNAVYFFVMLLSAAITFHAGAESGRGSNGSMDPAESEEYNDFLNYIYSFLEYTVSENNDGTQGDCIR